MVREKVKVLFSQLSNGLYEKEEAIKLLFLASIAGESVFLLGPPGVAKSLIARRMKFVFKDAKSFEYLMGRFSTPEEIFGPISISKLKNEDKYERIIEGYLPDAEIVFLDEIWKASPAIQNTLLTAINEKIFRNGTNEIKIKLKLLVAASNELPAQGEGLEALWDRFIIRLYVDGIKNRENFDKMITDIHDLYSDPIPEELKISNDELALWQKKIKKVDVPPEVLDIIDIIRKKIVIRNRKRKEEVPPIYISDRRWKKIVNILKTAAFLNARDHVEIMDCFLIPYMLWNETTEIKEVNHLVNEVIRDNGYKSEISTEEIKKEIEELKIDIEKNTKKEIEITKKAPKVYKLMLRNSYYSNYSNKKNIDSYYKIISSNPEINNKYILIKDFNQLTKKSFTTILLYYSEARNSPYLRSDRKYYARKVKENDYEFEIDEFGLCEIEYDEKKEKKIIGENPSIEKINEWDKKIATLESKLDALILKIAEIKEKDLEYATNNLFVDSELSKIAFYNLNKTSKDIAKLKIELEKLGSLYESNREII